MAREVHAEDEAGGAEPAEPSHPITRWLTRTSAPVFSGYAILAAFMCYFCMYAFRKPFTVGRFEGEVALVVLPPIAYKILLIISQVAGYCASKFLGIKIISEMAAAYRAVAIVVLIGIAEAALALFAVVPTPWDALCMVLNGLPLGMIWGLIFGYLEGRRLTEVLGAGLSASYIVASGAVKAVGMWLMTPSEDLREALAGVGFLEPVGEALRSAGVLTLDGIEGTPGVTEQWMPFATGLIFLPVMLFFVWMLRLLPPPTAEDEALRVRREPMDKHARRRFLGRYWPGIIALTGLYIFLTAYRDFRDKFAREIWSAIGYGDEAGVYALAEIPIAMAVLVALALVMLIKDNRRALLAIHGMMLAGSATIGLSTFFYQIGVLAPAAWMILVGLGLYIAYVPYGAILFDRLIAGVGFVATAGFLIYLTDSFGYLGSVALLLYKSFGEPEMSFRAFFVGVSYATGVVGSASFLFSTFYFARHTRPVPPGRTETVARAEP